MHEVIQTIWGQIPFHWIKYVWEGRKKLEENLKEEDITYWNVGSWELAYIGTEKWEWEFGKQLVLAQFYFLAPEGASLA